MSPDTRDFYLSPAERQKTTVNWAHAIEWRRKSRPVIVALHQIGAWPVRPRQHIRAAVYAQVAALTGLTKKAATKEVAALRWWCAHRADAPWLDPTATEPE